MWSDNFKKVVKRAMIDKDWNQTALAEKADVTPANLSAWLSGKRVPETASLQKLSRALGIPLGDLVNAIGIIPVEARPAPHSQRGQLPEFLYRAEPSSGFRPLQGWLGVAAGESREVERAEEPIYVHEKLPADHRYFTIHGDSMIETLQDKDIVVVKDLGEHGEILPALRPGKPKTDPARVKQKIPDKSIALLSINYEGLTVKRVKFMEEAGNWHLLLMADNLDTPGFPKLITRDKDVIFWALVVGVAKKAE